MRLFEVSGMSCGHCEKAIRTALLALEADAVVHVDLSGGLVRVEANTLTTPRIIAALEEAGYDARLVEENA